MIADYLTKLLQGTPSNYFPYASNLTFVIQFGDSN